MDNRMAFIERQWRLLVLLDSGLLASGASHGGSVWLCPKTKKCSMSAVIFN